MNSDFELFGLKPVHITQKAWGREFHYLNHPDYCMKVLLLDKGYRGSLHRHNIKTETFSILYGECLMEWSAPWEYSRVDCSAEIIVGLRELTAKSDDRLHVMAGAWHRFTGIEETAILEVSTHDWEGDCERLVKGGMVEKAQDNAGPE